MRGLLLVASVVVSLCSQAQEPAKPTEGKDGWVPLFNGKNLDGWTPKIRNYKLGDNFGETFRVQDGMIQVRYDKYDSFNERFGHLFADGEYEHYLLRVEYRFVGEQCKNGPGWAKRNSGIMIHGQKPETMDKDQKFPVSIEVQLLGGLGNGPRPTANLCTPGTNVIFDDKFHETHCTNSKGKTYDGEDWVTVELEVNGGEVIKHIIDSEVIIAYSKPQYDPKDADAKKLIAKLEDQKQLVITKGSISLQSESHPCDFRKVEIKVMKK
jgi:hypothetical protein